jgi:hypothetical protein
MRKLRFILAVGMIFLFRNVLLAQQDYLKNSAYGGFGRHGLLYGKYERTLLNKVWRQTFVNAGIGTIPGSHEDGIPKTWKLMPSVGQSFGYKFLFVELAIEPSFNFMGSFSYVELNSSIGLRYQNLSNLDGSPFFQAGYYYRLYRTHVGMAEVPIYMGVGMTF